MLTSYQLMVDTVMSSVSVTPTSGNLFFVRNAELEFVFYHIIYFDLLFIQLENNPIIEF